MPLALMLQAVTKTLTKGAERLTPWNRLVEAESLLLARARSAFLVHWFGQRLPVKGLNLRVAISNDAALRERYLAVRQAALQRRADEAARRSLNLTEPLAGLAGTLFGSLLSPASALAVSIVLARRVRSWAGLFMRMFGWIAAILAPAIGLAAAVVGLPVGLLGALAAGLANRGPLRSLHALLGAVAEMIVALDALLRQLLGPRQQVRNPLVRQLLELGDRLARLVPLLTAFVALLIGRLGPLIVPVGRRVVALRELISRAAADLGAMVGDLVDRLTALGSMDDARSPLRALLSVFNTLWRLVPTVFGGVIELMTEIQNKLARWGTMLVGGLRELFSKIGAYLRQVFDTHPLIGLIRALISQIQTIRRAWRRTARRPTARRRTSEPGVTDWILRRIQSRLRPLVPSVPSLPELPDVSEIERRLGGRPRVGLGAIGRIADILGEVPLPAPFRLRRQNLQAVQRAARPLDVFGAERRALGPSPREELQELRGRELELRRSLISVVDRVLPPEVRVYLPDLLGVFQRVDHLLTGQRPRGSTEFPVRDLPESDRLRPVVHRLTVRVRGGEAAEARAWSEVLRGRLVGQSYLATETSGAI